MAKTTEAIKVDELINKLAALKETGEFDIDARCSWAGIVVVNRISTGEQVLRTVPKGEDTIQAIYDDNLFVKAA